MGKWQRIQFQPGVGIGPEGSRVTACEVHRTLSKEAAKEGMVLLKMREKFFRWQRAAVSLCLAREPLIM